MQRWARKGKGVNNSMHRRAARSKRPTRARRSAKLSNNFLRARDPLHESPRRGHLRSRAVCRVANTRNSYGYCCVLRLAALPDPQRPLSARFVQRVPSGAAGAPAHAPCEASVPSAHRFAQRFCSTCALRSRNCRHLHGQSGPRHRDIAAEASMFCAVPKRRHCHAANMLERAGKRGVLTPTALPICTTLMQRFAWHFL